MSDFDMDAFDSIDFDSVEQSVAEKQAEKERKKAEDDLEKQIREDIEKNKINYVIDATHPFALIISQNLDEACKKIKKPLLTFERKSEIKPFKNFNYIKGLKNINNDVLVNKNILLAIGSRLLNETASYYLKCGANVFTRVLPAPRGGTLG